MAMLRLASSKVVANAVRAVASPSILSGSIIIVPRETYAFQQFSFSTVTDEQKRADKQLAKLLKFKIKTGKRLATEMQVPEAPAGFPFEIRDIPGESTIKLTREFEEERIVIEVNEALNPEDINVVSDSSDDKDDNDDDISIDGRKSSIEPHCFFTVTVTRKNGAISTDLLCRAKADSLAIRSIDIKGSPHVKGSTIIFSEHEGDDLEEYWRKAYLGVREIGVPLSRFMVDYMIRRSRRDRFIFLNKFRKFVKDSN